jgi:hypothetical protein
VLHAVIAFRAVPRVVSLLGLGWIPHFSSVIHWTLRLGLALLTQVKPVDSPWVALLDYSLAFGTQKVLVVLRVPLDALAQRGSAVTLDDCECVGLQVNARTDGETVAHALTAIFAQAGSPAAILKDGGSDLHKGVTLWQAQANRPDVAVIADLGHVLANALEAQFAPTVAFQRFVAILARGAARLRQTSLAFLIPPTLRCQGRFQGITRLGRWAERILSAQAHLAEPQQRRKLRHALAGLASLRPFLQRFALTLQAVAEVLAILKHRGLCPATYHECLQQAARLPPRSVVKQRLLTWLQRHLDLQQRLGPYPLLVSSDIIESLFGKFKYVMARGGHVEMNRLVLVLPALCGRRDEQGMAQALAHTSHRDLEHWVKQNIPTTLRQQRQAFFRDKEGPKTGKATVSL